MWVPHPGDMWLPQILSPNKQHPQHNLPSPQLICGTIEHFWLGGKTLAIEVNIHKSQWGL